MAKLRFYSVFLLLLVYVFCHCHSLFATPQDTRYESLLKELRCLVCQNQDLLDSHATLALDLKKEIILQLSAGKSDEEIRHYLADRYGEFILFKPLVKPNTWVLWFGPGILLFLGLSGLGLWVARGQRHD